MVAIIVEIVENKISKGGKTEGFPSFFQSEPGEKQCPNQSFDGFQYQF